MNALKGWKAYVGGLGQIAAGAFLLYWSQKPGVNPNLSAFLLAQGMIAIPSGLAAIGIRHKQARIDEKLDGEHR